MVLVLTAIVSIVMTGFLSLYTGLTRSGREITAFGGATDLSHGLDALFQSPNCANLGANSFTLSNSPVSVVMYGTSPCSGLNPPPPYCLSLDTISFPNGFSTAVTTNANPLIANMIDPYFVNAITFTGIGGQNATQYPFQLTVTFATKTGFSLPPPTPIQKYVTVYTDPNNPLQVIGACYAPVTSAAGAPVTAGMVIGGFYVTPSTYCAGVNNPQTGAQTCPTGFTAKLFGGAVCNTSDAADRLFYICVGPASAASSASAISIGGWYYTASSYCPPVNDPATNGQTCPTGFTAHPFASGVCNWADPADRVNYVCVASAATKGFTIGGWYTTPSLYCPGVNNPLTGALSCPPGFSSQLFGGGGCETNLDPADRLFYLCVQ
jgi:hypothetical protein